MPRLFLCALLIFAPIWGHAASCEAVAPDSARLACYDAIGECTGVKNPAERLACFDKTAGEVSAEGKVPAEPVASETRVASTPASTAVASAPQASAQKKNAAPRDDFGVRRVKPSEIRTSIVGEFDGWDGSQKFEMANGQVWEHRKLTRRSYPKVVNPSVLIRKNLFGFYMMDVEGTGATLPVKRIK